MYIIVNKIGMDSTVMEFIIEGQENINVKQITIQIISDTKGKFQGVVEIP